MRLQARTAVGPAETRGGAWPRSDRRPALSSRPLPLGCGGSHLREVTKVSKILFPFSSLKEEQKYATTLTGRLAE